MQLASTLFLVSVILILVTLQSMSAIEIEAIIGGNLEGVGMALIVLAIVAMWQGKLVQKIAFYVAVAGAAYLVLQHSADIAAIVKGLGI